MSNTSAEKQMLISSLASGIRRRGLTGPAVILLETLKPLSFIGSQLFLMLSPLLSPFAESTTHHYTDYAGLLKDEHSVDQLLAILEGKPTGPPAQSE